MPMSIRLDLPTSARIRRLARAAGKSKSWVVREAVAAYEPSPPRRKAADLLRPFIGAGDSGWTDLSEKTGDRFAERLKADARARRSR